MHNLWQQFRCQGSLSISGYWMAPECIPNGNGKSRLPGHEHTDVGIQPAMTGVIGKGCFCSFSGNLHPSLTIANFLHLELSKWATTVPVMSVHFSDLITSSWASICSSEIMTEVWDINSLPTPPRQNYSYKWLSASEKETFPFISIYFQLNKKK